MSGKTGIQWTDRVWNPTTGCTRVSAGCDHCYAFQVHDQRHIAWKRGRFPGAPAQYHKPFSQVQLLYERLEDPLHWKKPQRIFVNSMSDLFHEDIPDEFIRLVFAIMGDAPQHTFQILTKRPDRMQELVAEMLAEGDFATLSGGTESLFPWPNVWLGVSVENQTAADERIPLLLETPAAVRFLSCEPLLGPVKLDPWLELGWICEYCYRRIHAQRLPEDWAWQWQSAICPDCQSRALADGGITVVKGGAYAVAADPRPWKPQLDWVIIGGESGPHARSLEWSWVGSLMKQCQDAHIALFMKQFGTQWAKFYGWRDRHGGDWDEWQEDWRIREFPR